MKPIKIGPGTYEGKYQKWDSKPADEYQVLPAGTYLKKRVRRMIVALGRGQPSAKHSYAACRPIHKRDRRYGEPTVWERILRTSAGSRVMGLADARKAVETAIVDQVARIDATLACRSKKSMAWQACNRREQARKEGLERARDIIWSLEREALADKAKALGEKD